MPMSKYRQCISIIILFQIMLFRFSLLLAQLHTINIVHSPLGKCHPWHDITTFTNDIYRTLSPNILRI